MSFLGLMTVRAHEAVTREWDLRCVDLMEQRDGETIRANKLAAELEAVKAERDAILRDKKLEVARRTDAVTHSIAMSRELAALRPDAQKWRDRKKADREYRAERRKAAA